MRYLWTEDIGVGFHGVRSVCLSCFIEIKNKIEKKT